MAAYAQRTDLNSSAMTPEYGGVKALADAQRAVPMAQSPTGAAPQVQRPVPGEGGSLTRSTDRPQEPITAGAPFGAGPGPTAAGIPINAAPMSGSKQDLIERVRAIYSMYPNPNLMSLMAVLESQ
jgi:hypothetical protein